MFTACPKLVNNFMQDLFSADGATEPALKKISRYVQKTGFFHVRKDLWAGIKSF